MARFRKCSCGGASIISWPGLENVHIPYSITMTWPYKSNFRDKKERRDKTQMNIKGSHLGLNRGYGQTPLEYALP